MKIITVTNAIASENTYILSNNEAILVIDPGSNGDKICQEIKKLAKPVAAILLTHTHYDHIFSLEKVRQSFNQPPVYVSGKEASWLFTPKDNLSGLLRHADIPDIICKPAEQLFEFEKDYHLAGFTFSVVETPGHSIGGLSFIFKEHEAIFSGDALFRESIGRSDLPTGNYEQLIEGIKEKLLTQPSFFKVYPGHGQMTTIAHEKNSNPFLS
ncbi:MBL fold metallo-hydrolase [Streptococcus pseudoporcinus]|uniref:Metallo-beta-lactamase domain protein n=1 Tax=Streptococcus pseudoporcinus LQ 940-04 TaxID=875093 RepID=G5K6J9_9STRE|nr:MBL fold metallo-hydrolase [Streptococcus pseudoporcinus]EFR44790.1 metallo-beta-lactamase domain protein [Streptococcus pseudoporcinus SPIN 20026]EHI65951.1 metallo-beta-lactamase domain protein [Streptococcus pseudoporcinus LQ 940-04]VEF94553.1 metallo-beta-lactamase superfamily protein [Streptococcus pseudoporcinus]